MVTITKNDYQLSWGVHSGAESIVSVVNDHSINENLSEKDQKQSLKNLCKDLIYKDVKPGIDLKYLHHN